MYGSFIVELMQGIAFIERPTEDPMIVREEVKKNILGEERRLPLGGDRVIRDVDIRVAFATVLVLNRRDYLPRLHELLPPTEEFIGPAWITRILFQEITQNKDPAWVIQCVEEVVTNILCACNFLIEGVIPSKKLTLPERLQQIVDNMLSTPDAFESGDLNSEPKEDFIKTDTFKQLCSFAERLYAA